MAILVVAEKDLRRLSRSFSLQDHDLFECKPSDCHKVIEQCHPDIILLDSGAETGNGLNTLKDIKGRYPGIPVIFLADLAAEDIVLSAFKAGARDFFRKPVILSELQETVDGILSIKKSAVERRRPFKTSGFHRKDPLKKMTTSHPVNLIQVMRHIEDNLTTPTSLEDLAAKAGLSKYHFCRFFKTYIGMSPMKYLLSRRIAKARELLKREDLPISTVASSVGFNDMSSFTVQFKKFSGKTPIKFKLSKNKTKKKSKQFLRKARKPRKKARSS